MSDEQDKPWRMPDAKQMTFDEMAARAQYEWERAEAAEAEAEVYAAERDTLTDRVAELEAALNRWETAAAKGAIHTRKDLEDAVTAALEKAPGNKAEGQ
jgi:hypothetical protein